MSIIIIIMSILVPALSGARRFAANVRQKAQFFEISKGLETFEKITGAYPDSSAYDVCTPTVAYCGAMRLCEAMMGQDGMGFHPDSGFTANAGMDPHDTTGTLRKYPFNMCTPHTGTYLPEQTTNLRYRDSGRYLDIENVKAYRLADVYGNANITPFNSTDKTLYPNAVISDVFLKPTILASECPDRPGEKVGMPVLYYKADTSMVEHRVDASSSEYPMFNIYRYTDNDDLTNLGLPWQLSTLHPLSSLFETAAGIDRGTTFYQVTRNKKVTSTPRPHNEGKYILISAGWDGLYGTSDDVYNFTD
jgi:type II secretory pathway pseudopilin PulG